MKTGLGSIQGVIFVSGLDLSNNLAIAQIFSSLNTIKFDGNPTLLPLPNNAPLELPRIILKTNDNKFSLNISPARVDLFFNNNKFDEEGTPNGKIEDIELQITSILEELVVIVTSKLGAHIPRIALVSNTIFRLEESAKKYLLNNFIKNEALQTPDEMQLNFLLKKEINKYKYNEWIRFNTLRNDKNRENDQALLIILDFNSLAEIDYNFNKNSSKEFIKACFSLSKSEISQYTINQK